MHKLGYRTFLKGPWRVLRALSWPVRHWWQAVSESWRAEETDDDAAWRRMAP